MREMQLKTGINDEEKEVQNEMLINDEENNEFVEEKVNTFKLTIIKQFNYLNNHYILNIIIKLLFGIIIITFPFKSWAL